MKTTLKIASIAMLTAFTSAYGQEKVTTESGGKSDFIYQSGIVAIGQTSLGSFASPDTNKKLQVNGGITLASGAKLTFDPNNYTHAYSAYNSSLLEARYLNFGYYGHRWDTRTGNAMVILGSNNNVGIGTDNPKGKLTVNGNIIGQGHMYLNPDNGTGYLSSRLYLESHNDYRGAGIVSMGQTNYWYAGNPYRDHANSYMIGVAPKTSSPDAIGQLQYAKFYINSNGSVGVGTTTPNAKFEVFQDTNRTVLLNPENQLDVNGKSSLTIKEFVPSIEFSDATPSSSSAVAFANNGKFFIGKKSGQKMTESEVFAVDLNTGNIGVGTVDTSGFKLGVNGKVAALEVKVAAKSNWPDYVFQPTYDLPSLTEVEEHIRQKGHLANIPSAEIVAKEGFYLADMDARLLEKIEQLTLYTIQQQKEIETLRAQQKKIKTLEEENKLLKSLLIRVQQLEKKMNEK
ncbi:hypothetical protein [Tenacibaculum litopenaei]|uniref:hypothetical protein n=1 Tax=Tenacibaculum litopenaei TaxID=396016 RepID=UPI0038B50823